jgi:hypothetical protein
MTPPQYLNHNIEVTTVLCQSIASAEHPSPAVGQAADRPLQSVVGRIIA